MSKDELIEQMVPHTTLEEGCYRIYAVFESDDEALSGETVFELSDDSKNKTIYGVLHTWDRKERTYTKVFDIKEYPTFLIVNHEDLVFQSENFQEADEFLSSVPYECGFHINF